jgi:hypothetical protein
MKLRVHDNFLRLRLSQSDVAQLRDEGSVEERLTFSAGQALIYSISTAPVLEVGAGFDGNRLSVVVPTALARTWIDSDQVGIEGPQVLIEKDFQCLHRASADDADGFPNPLART